MDKIELQAKGNPLIFTGQSVTYAGNEFYFSKMSNIAHRGGEQPAYLFDYDGRRLALPYDPKDKAITLKIFQQVAAMEKKRKEAAVPEPPKEEPVAPIEDNDFSMFDVPEPAAAQPSPGLASQLPTSNAQMYSETKKGYLSVGRLVIGIISMVLFIFIAFQSCAAGLSNALEDNNATSGSAGLFTAIMFLAAGIVGVCTRNKNGIVGPVITAVLYFIGAAFTLGTGNTYGDLPIWGAISAIFGLVFVFCAVKTKLEKTAEPFYKPLWLIIVVVVIAILALVTAFVGSGSDENKSKDSNPKTTAEQDKSAGTTAEKQTTGEVTYQSILDDYTKKIKAATPKLVKEYNSEAKKHAGDINELAKISTKKIETLAQINTEGAKEMAELMTKNGDKYETYEDWVGKLYKVYEKYAGKITDAYMDSAM